MPLSALIDQYLAGSEALRQAVRGLSHDQLTARPVPGKWSTLGVVAHIADFESIIADRMMRVISHERPLLLVADENLMAATLDYQNRDVDAELALVDLTRKRMARILRKLPVESVQRVGVHTFRGLVSLEAILTSAVQHIPHHIAFIEETEGAGCLMGPAPRGDRTLLVCFQDRADRPPLTWTW
jgi:DinB superfamily